MHRRIGLQKNLTEASPVPTGLATGLRKTSCYEMSTNDCSICLEEITASTGKTVLGCGHEFHLRCTVQWFGSQKGEASTCPFCRKESGHLDDLPSVAEMGDGVSDGDSDNDGDWIEEEEVVTRMTWVRQSTGHWEGELVVENQITHVWDPTAAVAAPTEISEGAVALQRIWRGYKGRGKAAAMAAAAALIKMSQGPEPKPWEWIAGALDNDPEWEDDAVAEVAATCSCCDGTRIHMINNYFPIDHVSIESMWARINAMSDDDE